MAEAMNKKTSQKRRWTPAALVVAGLFHTVGVILVFLAMVSLSMPISTAWGAVFLAWTEMSMQDAVMYRMAIQFGLSGCLWAIMAIVWCYLDLGALTKREPRRVVARARGVVATETLIAMPVLLLLILGMFQLSLNNMSGILFRVADFQAARTVWVWAPETDADLEDRVRIAVALVMAPTAPGNYRGRESTTTLSPRAVHTRDIMSERFVGFSLQGFLETIGLGGNDGSRLQVARGLDGTSSQAERARRKFTHAYQSTVVAGVDTEGEVGATFTYHQFQSMPLVGVLFGERAAENAYFQPYQSSYRLPEQIYVPGRPSF